MYIYSKLTKKHLTTRHYAISYHAAHHYITLHTIVQHCISYHTVCIPYCTTIHHTHTHIYTALYSMIIVPLYAIINTKHTTIIIMP